MPETGKLFTALCVQLAAKSGYPGKLFIILLAGILLTCQRQEYNIDPDNLPAITGRQLTGMVSGKKITLFHFWTTWCTSCAETFGKIHALQEKYPELNVVSVSLDETGNHKELIVPADTVRESMYRAAESPEALLGFFPEKWSGGVPLVIVTSGTEARYFYGIAALSQIDNYISFLDYRSK